MADDSASAAPLRGCPEGGGADVRLFADSLAVDEWLPVEFVPGRLALPARRCAEERCERLLASLSLFEDRRTEADFANTEPGLHRIEAKLDMVLDMVGEMMLSTRQVPPEKSFLWSRNGMRVDRALDASDVGACGVVRMLLSPKLPRLIEIPATVTALEPQGEGLYRQWLAFDIREQTLLVALDRHLIRTYRRRLAEARC